MAPKDTAEDTGTRERPGSLDALSEAIESGAGLPSVARAAARVLGASVALIDRSSAVLAVAAGSPAEETKLLEAGAGVESVDLRVADSAVGRMRYRARKDAPDAGLVRVVTTLLALELERARSPQWANEEAAGEFVRSLLARELSDREAIVARAAELGTAVSDGAGVAVVRAHARRPQEGDWRARTLTLAIRAVQTVCPGTVAAQVGTDPAEVALVMPAADDEQLERGARALQRELEEGLDGIAVMVGHSRLTRDPVDLYRAGYEARLAANVGEAEGKRLLAFEDTGSYRLLLGAMSEDPQELQRFYSETILPLSEYDTQYETDLVATVEAFLGNDGNVSATAATLFTHRHTVRYRLERVRDLSGHDLTSSDGRERLSLGLKAMRVLGIAPPGGPAFEPGTEAGKVPR